MMFPAPKRFSRKIGLDRDSLMLIRVLCKDKGLGFVEDYHLDDFIGKGVVEAFFRPGSNEWVDIEKKPIRKKVSIEYKGPERRKGTRILPSLH